MVSNPWRGVETLYRTENMVKSEFYRGLMGTISDICKRRDRYGCIEWDWCIEILLGTIWCLTQDFDKFIRELSRVWLHEYLHMIINWEKVYGGEEYEDDEKAVKSLEELMGV